MYFLEALQNPVSNDISIFAWEVIFYAAVITMYAFSGRSMSCLINTFAFTFYWGFKSLLPATFAPDGFGHMFLFVYVLSGLTLYATITLSDLKVPRKAESFRFLRSTANFNWCWR